VKSRSLLLALAALPLLALPAPPRAVADGIALGDAAPMSDASMRNVDGKDVTIASVQGKKGTLVVFTCNHCPWAKAWETRIVDLGNGYKKKGVGVIAINPNDPSDYPEDTYAEMQKRAKQRKIGYPYVVDATSNVARAFGASHTPEAYLFDAGGKLVYHGGIDDNAKQPDKVEAHWLRDALDAVVAGKAVPLAETKAFGCSIKFRKESS
jgi:peroxiredoxin